MASSFQNDPAHSFWHSDIGKSVAKAIENGSGGGGSSAAALKVTINTDTMRLSETYRTIKNAFESGIPVTVMFEFTDQQEDEFITWTVALHVAACIEIQSPSESKYGVAYAYTSDNSGGALDYKRIAECSDPNDYPIAVI